MTTPISTTKTYPLACLAPPLSDERLAAYEAQIVALEQGELKDSLLELLTCVKVWWELPVSARKGERWAFHHAGKQREFELRPLEESHVRALWDVTPWMRELNTLSTPAGDGLFDALPSGELRNMAFHLLWFAKELTLDREPVTNDQV